MHRINAILDNGPDKELGLLLQAACRAALTGGNVIKKLFHQPHTVKKKGPINLVTEADIAAETSVIASLNEDVPGLPVLAEESSSDSPQPVDGLYWIIDPLDGTTNYAHGFPYFGTSIALVDKENILAGAVYCPLSDELFYALHGHGAWLNDRPIQVTNTSFLIEALIGTGFPYDIHSHIDRLVTQMRTILLKVRDIRRAGAAAVDLAFVACGRLDGFFELDLQPWDTAAGQILVEEAGGQISRFNGAPYSPFAPDIVASNGHLHALLTELIQ